MMREFELLTIARIHEHLASVVEPLLLPLGFRPQKSLHWVRSVDAPVRQMFAYCQLKGGVVSPMWGFSLDFVPHLSGDRPKWHRTEKSAQFDALVDGQGEGFNLPYIWGLTALMTDAAEKVNSAVASASRFWAAARSFTELYALVNGLRLRPGTQLYFQLPLTNAFCLARSGRITEARAELDYFCRQHADSDEARLSLSSLLESQAARPDDPLKDACHQLWH